MVEQSDIIFVMDYLHEAVLLSRFPRAARKTFLLGACSEGPKGGAPKEILDPFGRGLAEILKCYGEVRRCVQTLTEWLRHGPA
jgi:protein-tyrosine-phosphatase